MIIMTLRPIKCMIVVLIALAVTLPHASSLEMNLSQGKTLDSQTIRHIVVNMVEDTVFAKKEETKQLPQSIQLTQSISNHQQQESDYPPFQSQLNDDNQNCGVLCLQCKKGQCVRFNWIGVICLVMLVANLLAMAYCIWLFRKRRAQGPSTKESLITEGSISRSISVD